VEYPWHPLFGQDVLIKGEKRGPGAHVLRCHVPGDERRDCLHIPIWMFDAATCTRMRLEPQPYVGLEALDELRAVLEVATDDGTRARHNRHVPHDEPGGVDARDEDCPAVGPSGSGLAVPAPESRGAELGSPVRGRQSARRRGGRPAVAPRQRRRR
jgi:hypothetical protein